MRTGPLIASLALSILTPLTALGADMTEYRIVFIRTGPAKDIPAEEQQKAFQGHFTNMTRMAEEGDLLIAGPFMDPRPDPMHRGLWIFDTDSDEEALELAATDPPGKLGIFVFESVPFLTDDALGECARLEKEAEAERLADPDIPDEWVGRAYRIAMIESDKDRAPARVDGVVILATLTGVDGNPETDGNDHRFVLLDATDDESAREILKLAGCDPDAWTLHGWYSTPTLTQLPALRD